MSQRSQNTFLPRTISVVCLVILLGYLLTHVYRVRHSIAEESKQRETRYILRTLVAAYFEAVDAGKSRATLASAMSELQAFVDPIRERAYEPNLRGLCDGWRRKIFLREKDGVIEFVSAGPDGVLGTNDDMNEFVEHATN